MGSRSASGRAASTGVAVVLAHDDAEVSAALCEALRAADVSVVGVRSARLAIEAIEFHRPSAAVIDLAMEEGRGWEILFATASLAGMSRLALDRRDDPLVRRGAFAAGADDVMAAPFDPEEFAARVAAALRRQLRDSHDGPVHRHGDLVVDVPAHEVRIAGRRVVLTPQQFAILRALCEARGATLHRSQLIARIAAVDDQPPSDRAVDLHVSRLRRRLGDIGDRPRYIEAVYGVGYRLAPLRSAPPISGEAAAAVLDTLGEAVLVLDGSLRIRSANRAAERLLERRLADVVGRSCEDLLLCRTCEGVALQGPTCIGRAALAGPGDVRHVRAVIRSADGPIPIVFSHLPIRPDGDAPLLAIELRRDEA